MKGNILVLKGQSRYNVLRVATDYMVEAFRKRGYHTTVLDLTLEEEINNILNITNEQYDLIFSIQALLFDTYLSDGKTTFLSLFHNTPIFGHIVDHPIYHSARLKPDHGSNVFIGCIDKSHIKYINKYYSGIQNVDYLPHGGFETNKMIPYKDRSIDIYFPSSYSKPENILLQIHDLPQVYQTITNIIIKKILENPLLHLQDALEEYLSEINFTYSAEDFTQLMNILSFADSYVRAYTRDNLIHHLIQNGLHITVSGAGWDKCNEFSENLSIVSTEGLDIENVIEIMSNSKFVLNHVPTFQEGMHERIFTSMLCGAICITNDFPIIHEEFTDEENIILYSSSDLSELSHKIKQIINSPDRGKEIADRGYQIAEKSHTWGHNVDKILEIVRAQ